MTKWRNVAVIVAVITLLGGCASEIPPGLNDTLPQSRDSVSVPWTKTVAVCLDTTESMKGFLAGEREITLYTDTLQELNDLFAGQKWEQNNYRADTGIWLVQDDVLKKGMKSDYYIESRKLGDSGYERLESGYPENYDFPCLAEALKIEGKDLLVLITDLHENESQSSLVIRAINEVNDRDDGKVFGLVGIKAKFSGKLFDLGSAAQSAEYGKEQPQDRPLYVVVHGYPDAVKMVCERLRETLKGEEIKASVFYEESLQGADYENFIGCEELREDRVWDKGVQITINDSTPLPVYEYWTKSHDDGSLLFSWYAAEGDRVQLDQLSKEFEMVELPALNADEVKPYRVNCLTENAYAYRWSEEIGAFEKVGGADCFTVEEVWYDPSSGKLYASLHLTDGRFDRGVWKIQWESMLQSEGGEVDCWWEDWNLGRNDWDPETELPDFSKTQKLAEYVSAMKNGAHDAERRILNGTIYLNTR